jgi:hypothetical protein
VRVASLCPCFHDRTSIPPSAAPGPKCAEGRTLASLPASAQSCSRSFGATHMQCPAGGISVAADGRARASERPAGQREPPAGSPQRFSCGRGRDADGRPPRRSCGEAVISRARARRQAFVVRCQRVVRGGVHARFAWDRRTLPRRAGIRCAWSAMRRSDRRSARGCGARELAAPLAVEARDDALVKQLRAQFGPAGDLKLRVDGLHVVLYGMA